MNRFHYPPGDVDSPLWVTISIVLFVSFVALLVIL